MLPVLTTQRVTTTVYHPHHLSHDEDAPYAATTAGERHAASQCTTAAAHVQFRPSTTGPRAAHSTDASTDGPSKGPVARVATAPLRTATAPVQLATTDTPVEAEETTALYWNTHARWQEPTSSDRPDRTDSADSGRDGGRLNGSLNGELSGSRDEVFLVDPLKAVRQSAGSGRHHRPTRLPRMASPALVRLKEEAAQRLARQRGTVSTAQAAPDVSALSAKPRTPTAPREARDMGSPAVRSAASSQTEAPDANQLAVCALFRQRFSAPDMAASGAEEEEESGSALSSPLPHNASSPHRRALSHPHTSSTRHVAAAACPGASCSAPTLRPPTVYDLRPTALPNVPSLQSATPLSDDDLADLTVDTWHRLYAQQAATASQLRWLLYQEQYERALLMRQEQDTAPLAFYNPLPSGTRGTAMRLAHPQPALTPDDAIHAQLDAVLTRLEQPRLRTPARKESPTLSVGHAVASPETDARTRSGISRPPAAEATRTPPLSEWERVTAELDGAYEAARAEKTALYGEGLRLLEVLRCQTALVDEERAARVALVRAQFQLSATAESAAVFEDTATASDVVDAIPLTTQFAAAVLDGMGHLRDQLLAEHARDVAQLHDTLTLQVVALHVFDRFVHDEARQREKLVAYHQFCLRVAAVAAATTEDGVDAQETSGSEAPALAWYTAEVRQDPIRRLRQQRLRYIGPTDSPFCSYLRYLEISITDRTEGDSRARTQLEEQQVRETMLRDASRSHERVVVWEDCLAQSRALITAEAGARSALEVSSAEQAAAIEAREAQRRRIAAAQQEAEVRVTQFTEDAYEQKHLLESKYLVEHLKVFRALRADCLLLAIQKAHEERDPVEMVLSWTLERSIFLLVQQERRLRDVVAAEETATREQLAETHRFFEGTFWPSWRALKQREADDWECLISVLFDEYVCRERLIGSVMQQRAQLFAPRLVQPRGVLTLMTIESNEAHNTAADAAVTDGQSFGFSASHLSQVADAPPAISGVDRKLLPHVLTQRSPNDTDRDAHLVLTSNAASSELRIPTFQSSMATSLPLSQSARTYWDSLENPPLDAGCLSGTTISESGVLNGATDVEMKVLQYRLLQSYGRQPTTTTLTADEDAAELFDTTASTSTACQAHMSPSCADQPVSMGMGLGSAWASPVYTTFSPASAGVRREVRRGKAQAAPSQVSQGSPSFSHPITEAEFPSLTDAFIAAHQHRGRDRPTNATAHDSTDDCPFPPLLYALEEDRDLDLRRTVVANLSEFCNLDDLLEFFS